MPRPAPRTSASRTPAAGPAQNRELRARGKLTMRKLLTAGSHVFAAKGYHATRVDDIVKLAETSHGTFYLYFSNKEDLFRALASEVTDAMHDVASALGPLEPGRAGLAALREWIGELSDLYANYGPVIRAWTEAEIGGTEFGRLGTDVLTEFTRVVYQRVAAVAPPDIDPGIASMALVAMLERMHYYALSHQVDVEHDAMVDTLARVIQNALFGAND